jgi:hypothetical protein
MSLVEEAAIKLESKLISSPVPVAVFYLHGSWVTVKTTTRDFERKMKATPERLMGIYDIHASVSDMTEDFAAMGMT